MNADIEIQNTDQNDEKLTAKKALRKSANRNAAVLLLIIFFMEFFNLAVLKPILNYLKKQNIDSDTLTDINYAIVFGVQFLFALPAAAWYRNRKSEHNDRWFRKPDATFGFIFKWTTISMGVGVAINFVFVVIFFIIQTIFGTALNNNVQNLLTDNSTVFGKTVVFISVAVFAPIFEEILFRGALLSGTAKHGKWFAAVTVGILFGLFHMNYAQIFYATVLGVILCFVALKTRSIIPCIIIHFFCNIFSAVLSVFMGMLTPNFFENLTNETGTSFNMDVIADNIKPLICMMIVVFIQISLVITGIILFIIEITKNKSGYKHNEEPQILTGKEKAKTYLFAPFTVILLVILMLNTVANAL